MKDFLGESQKSTSWEGKWEKIWRLENYPYPYVISTQTCMNQDIFPHF